MNSYTYNLTDFPNNNVLLDKLHREIHDSSIVTECQNIIVKDNCKINFTSALSSAENTTLDGIVAAHINEVEVTLSGTGLCSCHNGDVTQTINAAPSTILLNTPQIADPEFGCILGGVTINATNTYNIQYDVSLNTTRRNGRTGTISWLEVNGIEVPGTKSFGYHDTSSSGANTIGASCMVKITSGDVVRIRSRRYTGYDAVTLAHGCRLTIKQL